MLHLIEVENFRNLRAVSIKPAKITLLIGPNGSGKSGIIHSLAVLKQTYLHDYSPSSPEFVGQIVNLGSRKEVVFGHDENNTIKIGFIGTFNENEHTGTIKFDISSGHNGKGLDYILNLGSLIALYSRQGNNPEVSATVNNTPLPARARNQGGLGFEVDFDVGEMKEYERFFTTRFIVDFLKSIYVVQVPRGIAEFKTALPSRKSTLLASSRGLDELTKNMLSMISYDNELVDQISEFMSKLFGKKIRPALVQDNLGISQSVESIGSHAGTADFYSADVRSYAANTGFGLNQTLFLFTQVLDCPRGSTILIEEPEISLHPSVQRQLIDILISIAKSQDKQLIMTTHSEHIAFSLFRAIEQNELECNDVVVYSFNQQLDSSETKVMEVKTLEGSLKEFLGNEPSIVRQYIEAFGKTDQYLQEGTFG